MLLKHALFLQLVATAVVMYGKLRHIDYSLKKNIFSKIPDYKEVSICILHYCLSHVNPHKNYGLQWLYIPLTKSSATSLTQDATFQR